MTVVNSVKLTARLTRGAFRRFSFPEHQDPLLSRFIVRVAQNAADAAQVAMKFHVSSPVLLQSPTATSTLNAEPSLKPIHVLRIATQELSLPLQAMDEVVGSRGVCRLAG